MFRARAGRSRAGEICRAIHDPLRVGRVTLGCGERRTEFDDGSLGQRSRRALRQCARAAGRRTRPRGRHRGGRRGRLRPPRPELLDPRRIGDGRGHWRLRPLPGHHASLFGRLQSQQGRPCAALSAAAGRSGDLPDDRRLLYALHHPAVPGRLGDRHDQPGLDPGAPRRGGQAPRPRGCPTGSGP